MQSKKSSIAEAVLNQIVGFVLIYIAQVIYFMAIDVEMPVREHFGLMILSSIISMSKHYVIRRYFQGRDNE